MQPPSISSPSQDLAHAAMRNSQLPADVARADAVVRELHNLPSDHLWQGTAVDEEAAELVNPALSIGAFCHLRGSQLEVDK